MLEENGITEQESIAHYKEACNVSNARFIFLRTSFLEIVRNPKNYDEEDVEDIMITHEFLLSLE